MTAPAVRPPVPWRTIWAVIGSVLLTLVALELLRELAHVVTLLVVSLFFAVVLGPAVDFFDHRLPGKRVIGALIVFLGGIVLTALLLFAFIQPLVGQTQDFVENFPGYLEDAREGRGPVGRLVTRYDLDERVQSWQEDGGLDRLRDRAGGQALTVLGTVASGVFSLVTVLVLTFLLLLEGPRLADSIVRVFRSNETREHVRRVARDCAKAVTGYVAGNLAISVIAGVASFFALLIIGVPFQGVLALWVAFADLIPLVGATLGAIPAVLVAFLHSTRAGVLTLVFFVVYQQFENHVLQVTIMSRTVKLNPLAVLVSVLAGVELAGVLGALLAIPVAGIIQVLARDLYDEQRGRLKPQPTVGADEVPVSQADEEGA